MGWVVSGVRATSGSIRDLQSRLAKVSTVAAQRVAQRGAPRLTGAVQSAFASARTVYGDVRPFGVKGPLTLRRTGAIESALRFASVGTVIRSVLGPKYARYLIRYGILPNGSAAIPASWQATLGEEAKRALDEATQ